ncbi:MAG: hypothetical protein KAS32_29305, partial [Candidatus Peribacteraceae bacterium]|nr:hypothetical protein [Candidatus Peribacteraceae bacterium]
MKNYLTIFLFLYASAALAGILKIAPGDSRHLNLLPGRHFNPGVVSTSAPAAENPFAWDLNTNSRIFQYEFVDNTDPTAD